MSAPGSSPICQPESVVGGATEPTEPTDFLVEVMAVFGGLEHFYGVFPHLPGEGC